MMDKLPLRRNIKGNTDNTFEVFLDTPERMELAFLNTLAVINDSPVFFSGQRQADIVKNVWIVSIYLEY